MQQLVVWVASPSFRSVYYFLPAFFAHWSLQYFFLLSKVVKAFLQTGHFLSIQITLGIDYCHDDKAFLLEN